MQISKKTYLTVWVPFLYKDPPVEASKKQGKHAFKKSEDYALSKLYCMSLTTSVIMVIIKGKLWSQGQRCF